jgi:hypothetical protein
LIYFGSVIDRGVWCLGGNDIHHGNLSGVLVGATSKARKGTSAAVVRQLMKHVDGLWLDTCVHSGLSSGEGLIWQIRDEVTNGNGKVIVDGVLDKRLMIDAREFSSALTVMKREGNTLSYVICDGWDGRPLQAMTKNSPARCAKPHLSISAHITGDALRRDLDDISMANGFANRFLFACVKRSKELPFGGNANPEAVEALANKIQKRFLDDYQVEKQITMDESVKEIWGPIYHDLTTDKPGLFGAITARGEAQVVRLMLLYAVLDGSDQIRLPHLKAALAVWRYCEDSVRYIFGNSIGDPIADAILRALRSSSDSMSRTDLHQLFRRNLSAERLEKALALLEGYGFVQRAEHSSGPLGGRPTEKWHAA